MANYSDHKKPFTNINELLPDVYKSDVSVTVFDQAFNRHLTKDDTSRVAGFIGTGNPQALVDRQIQEETPHRQAYQLSPTMYSKVGSIETALSFKAFTAQLELMGVNIDRLPLWGNALKFNWVPPVNIDMIINYQDYFWKPDNLTDPAQYFTIENRCNKAQSKVQSYQNVLQQRGDLFAVTEIDYAENAFVISDKYDDLYVAGFVFFTKDSTNINLEQKFWTVDISSYDDIANETTIRTVEPIAIVQPTPPVATFVGQWWYDTTIGTLKEWNGTAYVPAVQAQVVDISLYELSLTYEQEANCVCNQTTGWDVGQWDELDVGQWDFTAGCEAQTLNQWSAQNKWIHKTQVQSFADVKRAQVPIFEYDSRIELNEWTHYTFAWKYRVTPDVAFAATTESPAHEELEPIKGYVYDDGQLYLYDQAATQARNIDYTQSMIPGYRIRVVDDTNVSKVYTIATADFREMNSATPAPVTSVTGENVFVTVVTLVEAFTSAAQGGGVNNTRIEPVATSVGDTWRGYHVHWLLDVNATSATPTGNKQLDIYLQRGLVTPAAPSLIATIPVHTDDGAAYQPSNCTSISISESHQTIIVDAPGVTRIDLVDKFRFNPSVSTVYGTPNSGEVRVYINDVRQYGNYVEIVGQGVPNYTMIGSSEFTTPTIPYVQAIVLDTAVPVLASVRIEVGPASFSDMGWAAIPVRTVEDETQFTLDSATGTQPVYMSLTQDYHLEQSKTQINQYPKFNVYDVITGEVIGANQLFGFREDPTYAINSSVQRRIVVSSDGKEYDFEQYLLDRDDNLLYGYRNTTTTLQFWYSDLLGTVKFWDGASWDEDIIRSTSTGFVVRRAIAAALAPAELLTVDQALWYDTTNDILFSRDTSTSSWSAISNVVSNGADPTLQTVWKHGSSDEMFVPQYVDKNRNVVAVGSDLGDWGDVDQWVFNPEQHNRQVVKLSQLVTHFRTILTSQPSQPGLLGGGIYTLTQDQYNYGLGGTIKEYNDSFDTLISAVNVTNTTPVGVMDFASQEYASNLLSVRDLYNKSAGTLFTDVSQASLLDQNKFIAETVIATYENNDFTAQIYGDTTAYDPVTGLGVRNWIATAPMFGLSPLYRPHLNANGDFVQLFHHDGHRSDISYSAADQDRLSRIIIKEPDARVTNGTFGKMNSAVPPATQAAFLTAFGSSLRTGVYWYRVGSGQRAFFRLAALEIGPTAPSFVDTNGNEISDGTMYYNTMSTTVFAKQGLAWNAITVPGSGDISPLWVSVDFTDAFGAIELEIETRLYEVTPVRKLVFDYTTLTTTPSEQVEFDKQHETRFNTFVATHSITAPLVNLQYTASNAFTWNYASSVFDITPRTDINPGTFGAWQELYTQWYGTPYPQLEPWKLQGYHDKPLWWNAQYKDTTGARLWIYNHATATGMWENIRVGNVPAGQTYPDGNVSSGSSIADGKVLPQYDYFSVNISDATIAGSYAPDAVLPPYYNNAAIVADVTVRSFFTSLPSQVIAPDADYVFGDYGPTEWQWSVSAQSPYDLPAIAFLMQPVRFLHAAFGPLFTLVDELQVETLFKQVYSHEDALFHGDLYDVNQTYIVNGLNQWYVNFNRYSGYDTNGEFRELWAGWDPHLTYQFGGIIDTGTFQIANKYFDVISQDYEILLVNSGVFKDMWVDAFELSLLNIPAPIIQYNNQAAWKIELDSLAAVARDINYYGVKSYGVSADPTTDTFTIFSFTLMLTDVATHTFAFTSDQTADYAPGVLVTVYGSVANDGSYTIASSSYSRVTNLTTITVTEDIVSNTNSGAITLSSLTLPWVTGDQIVIASTKFLPAPLLYNTPYYVIPVTSRTFKLAASPNDAALGTSIDITTLGTGDISVSEIDTSFNVYGGNGNSGELWFHYTLDTSVVKTFTPPLTINGMQSLINIIDGYASYQKDTGILMNVPDSGDFDPDTGRLISWQLETERFINWAYGLRAVRMSIPDTYELAVDDVADQFTFTGGIPAWISGTQVSVSTTGSLPSPLFAGSPYYIVQTTNPAVFKLSVSANPNDAASIVDITTPGSGIMRIGLLNKQRAFPRFELNPTRNNVWIDTPLGVLSNVIEGPYTDIRVQQTIFDQYNRPLSPDQLTVYREDERSHIAIRSSLANDVDINYVNDPYNYIHIGGAHVFLEGYEHFLIFNDYTVDGSLVYDSFLGLNASKFDVDYYEKEDYTLRPTLGGYYLIDGKFNRNIEGSASDMQVYYDTLALSEASVVAQRARALVGYSGPSTFLDLLNIGNKSQFLFYRGMIQTKGSVNSVKAFINSRRFVDAQLDEFWAWKIATFGDARTRTYPEIKLFSTDGAVDDVRLEFLANSELDTDDDVVADVANGFQLVSFRDDSRWNIFPEQKQEIGSPLFLDAEVSSMTQLYGGQTPPPPGAEATITYWFDTDTTTLFSFNAASGLWDITVPGKATVITANVGTPSTAQSMMYFKHDAPCDDARVLHRTLATRSYPIFAHLSGNDGIVIQGNVTGDFQPNSWFSIVLSVNDNNNFKVASSSYSGAFIDGGTNETTIMLSLPADPSSGPLTGPSPLGSALVTDFGNYSTEIYGPGSGISEYTRVNSEMIRFDIRGIAGIVMIFTINPAKTKLSPARLIDNVANTVVQTIPLWDPARGYHSPIAIHNVDLQHFEDPARYEFTPNPTDPRASQNFWNGTEAGTVWLDTSLLNYLPYYDDQIYPGINNRLYNWGHLAPFGDIKVYQWTQSLVAPSDWNALVVQQTNDTTIAQNDKASGTARMSVFKRVRDEETATFDFTTSLVTTSLVVAAGDQVIFSTTGTLPTGVNGSTKYVVSGPSPFTLQNPDDGTFVVFTDNGSDPVTVVPAFFAVDWQRNEQIQERVDGVFAVQMIRTAAGDTSSVVWSGGYTAPTGFERIYWTPADASLYTLTGPGADLIDVYINGVLFGSSLPIVVVSSTLYYVQLTALTLNEYDMVDVVRPVHTVTATESTFNPDIIDDGTALIQWKTDFEYSTTTLTTGGTNTGLVTTTYYYFWVEASTVRNPNVDSNISPLEIEQQLATIPTPYFVVQKPMDDPYLIEKYGYGVIEYGSTWSLGSLSEADYQIPVLYRQAIIRKVASYINDDDRYLIRFTRDFSLRDDIQANGKQMNLKDKHEEWFLFRQEQTSSIPLELWNRLTEALIGYTLADNTVRVPALDRELYDATAGTDTRFGLGVDQAFCDKTLGLGTVLAYLEDPTVNFAPTDIDSFFANNSFDTPANIASSMNVIYTSFAAQHTNNIWFNCLQDALSTRAKYKELMKTSWIALHGIRVLEVGGLFDD